ncbi:serine/threonine-protein kinase [Planomonospora sp. ID82291]|uniref:serine/threonine-protein kinase n=1 Tax=Planomonospora sp. ID82291 TaxID=2738136 RepID=UPI0018C40D86|nr:serine/threonine-protein kinase [Planomonospora sp. ID82291]MBG0815313.1 serine/threonine protein kinase [Planomonospora sp. ID82291]
MGAPDDGHCGPYRLLSPLGAGGFGAVHLALDPEGRTVAVKVLHPHVAADGTALARLAREVEAMRRVRSPHVAELLDASLDGDRPYLATRYVQGRPLGAVVAADGPVAGDDLVRLARGLAEALAAIHAAGVVHRDLKPANVICEGGEPVVIDFGIACLLDSAAVTASGAVLGTPGYLAPEVLEGGGAGPEADVFAFAATLAHAATGRHPYGTGPASAVGYRVVHHDPDLDDVPSWLEPLLRECLARDPADRPTAALLPLRLGAPEPGVRAVRAGGGVPEAEVRAVRAGGGVPEPGVRAVRAGGGAPEAAVHEASAAGVQGLSTREWRPGRRVRPATFPSEARERRRAVLHRRWVVGTGLFTALAAATAKHPLPEVSLLLLTLYGSAMLVDGGVALFARRNRGRAILDLSCAAGVVALWVALAAFFSPLTLGLALGTVVLVLVVILLSS